MKITFNNTTHNKVGAKIPFICAFEIVIVHILLSKCKKKVIKLVHEEVL